MMGVVGVRVDDGSGQRVPATSIFGR